MSRLEALKILCQEYHGGRLAKKLTEAEFDEVVDFAEDNESLPHLEFEYKVNRMHLNKAKPKNWAVIQELLMCANTRAKGV